MPRPSPRRRLATVLFVDVVDSTRVAAEVGDRRWRDLVGRFRSIVRTELKRHKGREQDTAGDGFFAISSMDAGADAMWVLGDSGQLFEVDPLRNSVSATFETEATKPGVVVSIGDHVWVCDCEVHKIIEFDPASNRTLRTLTFPQSGFLVGLSDVDGTKTLWLLDLMGNTVTPIDATSGQAGQPIGIGENLHAAAVSFGSLWVARGDKLLRVRGDRSEVVATIPMPDGFSAGSIAADAETDSLWVGDCGCPIE